MGNLYSYYGIITKLLVYPPELSRIKGFCTNSNKKISRGGPPDPPFKQNCLRLYYNHNTENHLKKLKTYPQSLPSHHFSCELTIKLSLYAGVEINLYNLLAHRTSVI